MANVNLFDYINAKEIAAYVKENPINKEPYFLKHFSLQELVWELI